MQSGSTTEVAARAEAVIVAEVKPMRHVDVRQHNRSLHNYLRAQGRSGYSVQMQIRMDYLRHDGFHIGKLFESVVDKTYACALMGILVPNPTPQILSPIIYEDNARSNERC